MNETLRASFRSFLPLLAVTALFAVGGKEAKAQTAPANATIGNQASASYTDGSGITRTATSNTVITTVLQVHSFTLTSDNTKVANPGSPVYYPHTITNTGNGNDSFSIVPTNNGIGDNFDLTGLAAYADADGNGVPDNTTPITVSPTLATGESFRFVVAGTLPATATTGQTSNVTVTVSYTGQVTPLTNTDKVTVTNNAAIEIVKSISVNSGPSPTNGVVYTLNYRNTGNATATNLVITDVVPANETYVANGGTWSKITAALTDATGDNQAAPDGSTINYSAVTAVGPPAVTTVTATISSIPAQSSGSITFKVNINSGVSPSTINNQATFTYNDGVAAQSGNTNTVPFTVTASAGVTLGDSGPFVVNQGAAVKFTDLLTNTGNATDTFNIFVDPIAANNTFPAGTTFKFFKADGATPLVDTNGDGIVDSGAIPANTGNTTNIVVIAQLPNGYTAGGFTMNVIARSVKDPSVSDPGTNSVTSETQATVEITNAGGAGAGALTATPVTTLTGIPGSTQHFTIGVQNLSAIADTYALQFSNTAVFSPAAALPAGYTVTFRNAAGAVVTNTGLLAPAPSAVALFTADVFIPANAAAGNVDIYFRAASSTTGAADTKFDRVTVSNVNALSVEPDNFGQVFPGGTITYPHVIAAEGNTTLTNVAITVANTAPGFTAVVYNDLNGDGILQPNEVAAGPVTSIATLVPGTPFNAIVKVFAPAGVDPNTANVTTLTGTATGGATDKATDTTTVVSGDLKIEKVQAVDPDGATATLGFGAFTKQPGTALPGAFVKYQITVTNTGTVPVSNIVITDATPGYTQYVAAAGVPAITVTGASSATPAPTISPAAPADGYVGTFTFTLPPTVTLAPGGTMVVTFGVRINP